jgi:hypothetical protein
MTIPTLSLVMNVYNEEAMIADAIKSAEGVDEIIVADMESTDRTVEIAESLGAKVISLPHSGYCESGRQLVIDAATTDWCLMLDGDERLCENGIEIIRELIASAPDNVSAYLIPFHTYIGDRRIMASGWSAVDEELHERLFRRSGTIWPDVIHTNPKFAGEKIDLPEGNELFVTHKNFRDFTHLLEKFNRYTSTEGRQISESGEPPSMVKGMREGFGEIFNRYSPDEDGAMSFALSFAMMSYRLMSQCKAIEANNWETPDGVPSKEVMTQAVHIFWNALGQAWLQEQRMRVHENFNTSGNVEEAMRELRRLLEVWGQEATLLCDLGTLEFSAGHPDAALEHLQASVALKPDFEDAVRNRDAVLQSMSVSRDIRVHPPR